MVTLKDIAQQAGVSHATVSLVLNQRYPPVSISKATRERILGIAKQSGYEPNQVARALRSKRTRILGVLVPGTEISFYPQVINGIEAEAARHEYHIVICQTHGSTALVEQTIAKLRQQRVDGLILCPLPPQRDYYRRLCEAETRIVFLDDSIEGLDVPFADSDDRLGAALAVRHLTRLGHRQIATLRLPPNTGFLAATVRYQGYRQALEEAGIAPDEALVAEVAHYGEGYPAAKRLLATAQFTAFFGPTDTVAIDAMQAFREAGRVVPRDVAVVGYANLRESAYVTPPLTTVDQKPAEMGAAAVRLLMDLIENREPNPRVVMTTPELIVRESCGAGSSPKPL